MTAYRPLALAALTLLCSAAAVVGAAEAPAAKGSPTPEAQPGERDTSMETYYLGLIRKGEKWTAEQTPEVLALQAEHIRNINRLAAAGSLELAGPFLDGGDLRGIFLYHAASLEEAQALAQTDPAVKAGRLTVEIHPLMLEADLGCARRATAPPGRK